MDVVAIEVEDIITTSGSGSPDEGSGGGWTQ